MEPGHIIAIAAITMPFLMIICVQVAKVIGRTQQERMRLDIMRLAIERGQPIPPDALRPVPDDDMNAEAAARGHGEAFGSCDAQWNSSRNDVRAGLICIAVGAGLFMMFTGFHSGGFGPFDGLRWIGAIPGFVGIALLINGLIPRTRPSSGLPVNNPTTAANEFTTPRS